MDRKRVMELPVDVRREILKCQSELYAALECVEAVRSFTKYYEEYRRKDEPQAVHWTISKLLEAGRSYAPAVEEFGDCLCVRCPNRNSEECVLR